MENAPINTKNVYVLFNYKTRIVYSVEGFSRKEMYKPDVLPANTREKNIFLEHFYLKGRRRVQFRDYKVFDPYFHGTAKYKKTYDTISLSRTQYLKFLELISDPYNDCKTFSEALNLIFDRSHSLYYEYQRTHDAEKLARKTLKIIFNSINEELQDF